MTPPAPNTNPPDSLSDDPQVSQRIQQAVRRAAWCSFIAGLVTAVLVTTAIAALRAPFFGPFLHGAGWGFGIGLGLVLGGSLLNAVVGILDQAKSDLLGR